MGNESNPTWPMVMWGDKIIHVSEVPMLHPARLWPIVAPMMRDSTEERQRVFFKLMENIKTDRWLERSQPGQAIEDDLRATAYRLTQAVDAIVRIGTMRGEAGTAALVRLNGRLQWPSTNAVPLTFDQWQGVICGSITILLEEARRVEEALQRSGRKGKRGRRPKEARDGSLNDLKDFWSEHCSLAIRFQDFVEALKSGIIAERKRYPGISSDYLFGEGDARQRAMTKSRKEPRRQSGRN